MASLDRLPGDQRAVLQLVLGRGRSYAEIARLLSINPDAVRERALSALDAIGPQTRASPEDRRAICDYLLGQLEPGEVPRVRRLLSGSAAERAWAQAVSGELGEIASGPLPDIPLANSEPGDDDEPSTAVAPPGPGAWASEQSEQPLQAPASQAPDETRTPVPPTALPTDVDGDPTPVTDVAPAKRQRKPRQSIFARRRRGSDGQAASAAAPPPPPPPALPDGDDDEDHERPSSRRGGMVVIGLGVIVIIVILFVVLHNRNGSNSTSASAPPASATAPITNSTTPTTGATSTSAGSGATGARGATGAGGSTSVAGTTGGSGAGTRQINLNPPTGSSSKAVGIADVIPQGSATEVAIVAQHVPPNTKKPPNAYEVWLYNSPTDAVSLGFVNPGVGAKGKLVAAGKWPSNASSYRELIVTTETTDDPKTPGPILLEGAVSSAS